MANEARIDVIIGSAQAQSGASAVQRAVDGIKGSFIDLTAKAFVADQFMRKVWSSATQGAQFEETMGRLNRQMGTFNSTGQLMVNTLQNITQQTLGVDRAATMASRALSVGLNPDQIKTFTEAAMLLKNVMGTELPQAFDDIVGAAITGRAAVLANIGVYVDLDEEVKKLAVSTNRTTDQITKQEKAMLTAKAITGQIGEANRRLTDGMLSDADRLKQVEARWDNLWTKIGQGAKTAVIDSLDWIEKLKKGMAEFLPSNMAAGYIRAKGLDAGQPGSPVAEDTFGRAIVADTLGNLARTRDQFTSGASSKALTQLPTALQGSQLDAERERRSKGLQGDLDRTKAALDAASHLYEMDAQRQLVTQEELVNAKGVFHLRDLAVTGQALMREKQMEDQLHAQRVVIGFQSTEERITEEERYRSKVFDINQSLLANTQAFGIASVQSAEENATARSAAEQRLGERLAESAKSTFDIQEALRRQDLEATQTYYQGELDMANARFAGDQEIATKERELLREQLAFKLRLSQEEVDRLLFLRKANDFEGVRQITGRADASLNPRVIEGIVESASAKDMLAAERANGDFFAGWSRGLRKYAQDRDSAFGMSTDMARRTAQAMEQGFQTFFFKGMDEQFHGFKDVLTGILDFTKQIVSQMMAQMVTVGLINPGASALMSGAGSFFRSGGGTAPAAQNFSGANFPKFASGGSFMVGGSGGTDTTPVMFYATPGEQVAVTTPGQRGGASPISIQIINQVPQAEISVQRSTGSGGKDELMIMVEKAVDKNLSSGRHDKTLGQRFGVTPGRG